MSNFNVNFKKEFFCPLYQKPCKNKITKTPKVTCEYEIDLDTCEKIQMQYASQRDALIAAAKYKKLI